MSVLAQGSLPMLSLGQNLFSSFVPPLFAANFLTCLLLNQFVYRAFTFWHFFATRCSGNSEKQCFLLFGTTRKGRRRQTLEMPTLIIQLFLFFSLFIASLETATFVAVVGTEVKFPNSTQLVVSCFLKKLFFFKKKDSKKRGEMKLEWNKLYKFPRFELRNRW